MDAAASRLTATRAATGGAYPHVACVAEDVLARLGLCACGYAFVRGVGGGGGGGGGGAETGARARTHT